MPGVLGKRENFLTVSKFAPEECHNGNCGVCGGRDQHHVKGKLFTNSSSAPDFENSLTVDVSSCEYINKMHCIPPPPPPSLESGTKVNKFATWAQFALHHFQSVVARPPLCSNRFLPLLISSPFDDFAQHPEMDPEAQRGDKETLRTVETT